MKFWRETDPQPKYFHDNKITSPVYFVHLLLNISFESDNSLILGKHFKTGWDMSDCFAFISGRKKNTSISWWYLSFKAHICIYLKEQEFN